MNTQQQQQQTQHLQQSKVYFVSELCSGGSLQNLIQLFHPHPLDYLTAKFFISQLLHAITYLHARGICHRNISLQNILLSKPIGQDISNCNFMLNNIKLVNFSNAIIFRKKIPLSRPVGDMYIRAPEVIFMSILLYRMKHFIIFTNYLHKLLKFTSFLSI